MSISRIVVHDATSHDEVDIAYVDYGVISIHADHSDAVILKAKDLFSAVNLLEAAYFDEYGTPDVQTISPGE